MQWFLGHIPDSQSEVLYPLLLPSWQVEDLMETNCKEKKIYMGLNVNILNFALFKYFLHVYFLTYNLPAVSIKYKYLF